MELYDVMRTAFSAREFTADPVTDEALARMFENARFAPSGGNRQGCHIIVVREQATKDALAEFAKPTVRRYVAQLAAGESPWNSITPTVVDPATIATTPTPPMLTEPLRRAPVVLVGCVDLRVVASVDQDLDRVGIVSGASVYPLLWNVLLAARNEGLGGTLTTMPIGKPVRQLTKLKRKPVAEFAHRERWDGPAFEA